MNPLVFVHGLPDHTGTWERLIPLVTPNFPNVSSVGLPGLGDSISILDYQTFDEIADKLTERLPQGPSIYIGHDFGGILGSIIAEKYPQLISKLILINAPTPHILRAAIAHDQDQALRSSYATKIQSDPISVLSKNDFAFLKHFLFRPENNLSTEYLASLKNMWSNELTLLNIGHYYRLILNSKLQHKGEFKQPTTQIWSKDDPFLGPVIQKQMSTAFPEHEVYSISHDSHWIHCSDPLQIADILNKLR